MLQAVKQLNTNHEVIKFPVSELEKYLENYDIRHQDFNYSEALSPSDIIRLKEYYDDSLEKTLRIHNDDEVTYGSFDHLEQINKVLSKYKVNKSKSR